LLHFPLNNVMYILFDTILKYVYTSIFRWKCSNLWSFYETSAWKDFFPCPNPVFSRLSFRLLATKISTLIIVNFPSMFISTIPKKIFPFKVYKAINNWPNAVGEGAVGVQIQFLWDYNYRRLYEKYYLYPLKNSLKTLGKRLTPRPLKNST